MLKILLKIMLTLVLGCARKTMQLRVSLITSMYKTTSDKLRHAMRLRQKSVRDQSSFDWDPVVWPDPIGHMADWIGQSRGCPPLVLDECLLAKI